MRLESATATRSRPLTEDPLVHRPAMEGRTAMTTPGLPTADRRTTGPDA